LKRRKKEGKRKSLTFDGKGKGQPNIHSVIGTSKALSGGCLDSDLGDRVKSESMPILRGTVVESYGTFASFLPSLISVSRCEEAQRHHLDRSAPSREHGQVPGFCVSLIVSR